MTSRTGKWALRFLAPKKEDSEHLPLWLPTRRAHTNDIGNGVVRTPMRLLVRRDTRSYKHRHWISFIHFDHHLRDAVRGFSLPLPQGHFRSDRPVVIDAKLINNCSTARDWKHGHFVILQLGECGAGTLFWPI